MFRTVAIYASSAMLASTRGALQTPHHRVDTAV